MLRPKRPAAAAASIDFNTIWMSDSAWEKLSKDQLEWVGLDHRRAVFWHPRLELVACVVQRSIRESGKRGNFPVDARTLRLLNNIRNIKDCQEAFVVTIEEFDEPAVLHSITALDLKRHLHNKPTLEKEGSRYWWVTADFRHIALGRRGGYHYGVTEEPLWMQHVRENPLSDDEV